MTSSVTRVVAAVVEREQRFLVCQRAFGKRHGGLWEFPGGKLGADETIEEAAQRELAEELGLAVSCVGVVRFRRPDPDSSFVIEFVDVIADGEPEKREHAALAWVTTQELIALPLAPADRAFAETLQSGSDHA